MANEILVAGATGRTGKIIVEKLIQTGIQPRVLVRDLSAAHELWNGTVTYHQGDVRERQTLLPAMTGAEALVSAVGAQSPVGKNCPKRVCYEGVANLVQAAWKTGVKRFILISSIAVTRSEHPMNCFGRILDWKHKGEEVLRRSGLEYAVIRPGGLKDTPGGKRRLIFSQGDQLMGMISRSDLAEICLQALQYPHPINLTFEVIESDLGQPAPFQQQIASLAMD
jgi:uncharacterized protein YbjT (DUF2867 family)